MSAESDRLLRQCEEAQARLDRLLQLREQALEGCGPGPSPADIDRARAAAEAALALLATHERMAAA